MKTPLRILLVDDDTDDKEIFIEALNEIDGSIQCVTANDGMEALNVLDKMNARHPDFIFLDLNMPRLNGKMTLKEIKNRETLRKIPVIIYTTSKNEDDVKETRGLGASYFITKPYKFQELVAALSLIIYKNGIGNAAVSSTILRAL